MTRRNKQSKWFDEYIPEEVANSTLFKFQVNINSQQTIDVDIRADLEIDYAIIQSQLEDTPSEFAYWASIYSELRMQVSKIERQIKVRRGKLTDKAIKDATKSGVRLTDKQVQAIIEADDDLIKLELQLIIANKHCGKMFYMVEAIKMKSDNLRSLAGFARQEMATQK
jgi:hypothetical protein